MAEQPGTLERVRNRLQPLIAQQLSEGGPVRKSKEIFAAVRSDEYRYQDLPTPSCIRLLQIERAAPAEPIHCKLETVDLVHNPAFTALSYSWLEDRSVISLFKPDTALNSKFWLRQSGWVAGQTFKALLGHREYICEEELLSKNAELQKEQHTVTDSGRSAQTQTIFCDGKSMAIQPNLYNALLHLRQTRPGRYWIDAVSINQKDTWERSAQVQMMDKIYQSAVEVVVWLGDVPMLLIPGLEKLHEKFTPKSGKSPFDPEKNRSKSSKVEMAAIWLLTRRWFRRLWVRFSGSFRNRAWHNSLLTAFVPLWATHVKMIPKMLDSTSFFLNGGRWTVREWLDMTMGRKGTDPRDVIFAGLSLLDPKSVAIDQSLQLFQGRSSSEPAHPKLWSLLHADYNVDKSFVLLNLSACLLTHWNLDVLFSIALRYRMRPEYSTDWQLTAFELPSWMPNPSHWTANRTNIAKPLYILSNPACGYFPFPQSVQDIGPKFSADGKTLFVTAVNLDNITEHHRLMELDDSAPVVEGLLDWVLRFVPPINPITKKPGLEAFFRVLLSQYRPKKTLVDLSDADLLIVGCLFIDMFLLDHLSKLAEQEPTQPKVGGSSKMRPQDVEDVRAKYAELKAKHPNVPWLISPHEDKPTEDDIRQYLSNNFESKEFVTRVHNWFKDMDIMKTSVHDWLRLSVFITKKGYIGIGQNALRDGDEVFLIEGGTMPYIFAHVDETLRRKAREIRKRLDDKDIKTPEFVRGRLTKELAEVDDKLGSRDGWQLVGETYVAGVMNGEIASQMEAQAQRYALI
ncbi:HET-domain-containing protein [Periconia macrospinosa]|uniref:HET-domain-containing protein n=1 Tax=Periconia macrospinosa TaxID=97972 RepID=A0A2V1DPM1_9PLEO|nr:HET-domain-containing protein [Periconia macrospinosa]